MVDEDIDSFRAMLSICAEQYGKTVSADLLLLYFSALKDYDLVAIRTALTRHLKNPDSGMFMPKIADIVKMLEGSTQDSAFQAWSLVDKAVRQIGTGESVDFGDPIIHRVLSDMGGWTSLGTKTEDEWPFVAKEFENRYRAYKARGELPEAPQALIGNYDHQNSVLGYEQSGPVRVGFDDRGMLKKEQQTMIEQKEEAQFLEFKRQSNSTETTNPLLIEMKQRLQQRMGRH